MNRQYRSALLAATLSSIIFGFSYMFSRIAFKYTTPAVLLMIRFDLTFLLLCPIALWLSGNASRLGKGFEFLQFDLAHKSWKSLIAVGLVQPVGYFYCESNGISLTNATFSGVIISLIPLAGMLMGAVLLKELPSAKQIAFSVLSIAGVILMTLRQSAEGVIQPAGVVLLFGAVILGALFHILCRSTGDRYTAFERTFVMMGVAAVAFTGMALVEIRGNMALLVEPLRHGEFVTAVLYLAILSCIVAFTSLNYANSALPVAVSTAFANLTTVVSVIGGVAFLHEPFGLLGLLASAMILFGVWGVQRS